MIEADKTRFAAILGALAEIFGQEMSKPKLALYFAALKDLSIEQIEMAGETLAGTVKFFPRPVEFRELIEGSAEDRAAVAWRTFLRICEHSGYPSLQVTDGALAFAIEEMGGYREAVAKLIDASPEMERAHQKTFEPLYKIGATRNAPPKYLIGEFEARNRGLSSWVGLRDGRAVEAREVSLPVLVVGVDQVLELRLPMDLRLGALAPAAQAALAAGGEALRAYLPAPAPRLLPAGPIPAEERATPDEVREIQDAAAALAGGRRLTRRLLTDATPTESEAIQ